jgi:hypothetical protein
MDGEREQAASLRGNDRVAAFLERERAEHEAGRADREAAFMEMAQSLNPAYQRKLRLEEFREIGRGIGEALAANVPSESITAAIVAALKTAGLD